MGGGGGGVGDASVARRAGGFEAGGETGKAGRDVGLMESEEGGACGVLGRVDGLGDLVEGLADTGVAAAHCGWF